MQGRPDGCIGVRGRRQHHSTDVVRGGAGICHGVYHRVVLRVFVAMFSNQPRNVGLRKTKGSSALLAIREDFLPAAFPQVPLDCLAKHFGCRPALFVGGRLESSEQRRRNCHSIGSRVSVHSLRVSLPWCVVKKMSLE